MKARIALTLLLVAATLPAFGATAAPEEASVRPEAVQTVEAAPARPGETAEATKAVRVPASRDPLLVLWADPERVVVPGENRLCATIALTNERVCVCECECSNETVQIRCDSNTQDCSKLNGAVCLLTSGNDSNLTNCTKKFVKP